MIRLIILAASSTLLLTLTSCALLPGLSGSCANTDGVFPKPEPDYEAKRVRDFSAFESALGSFSEDRAAEMDALLAGATVLDIQQLFESGDLSSEELTVYYIDRIQRYDVDQLNSVMELNPQALEIARSLDEERASGTVRGDMHGIPVLLKDNIATGDGLHAAAGAAALADWQPDRDAFLVQQLRENGAIVLGKANLSEWANWMDKCMPNGFSALGGQTRNPFGPFDTFGSSSGSAVSAAANLAAVTVGSETQGSIIAPAAINGVIAIKTSIGLVSRDYIIPLLPSQDVPGPMGRTVTDVAVLLTAMTGTDHNDPATNDAEELAGTDFTQFLDLETAKELKVGMTITSDEVLQALIKQRDEGTEGLDETIEISQGKIDREKAIRETLTAAGVEVVEVVSADVPIQGNVEPALTHGFKLAINEFLAGLGDQVAVSSLEDIVKFNKQDPDNRAPYGQDHLDSSMDSSLSDEDFATMEKELKQSAQDGLDAVFEKYDIGVLITGSTQAYAQAGYPALTIPGGTLPNGQPQGILLVGPYLGEPALISVAYLLEQAGFAYEAPEENIQQ